MTVWGGKNKYNPYYLMLQANKFISNKYGKNLQRQARWCLLCAKLMSAFWTLELVSFNNKKEVLNLKNISSVYVIVF